MKKTSNIRRIIVEGPDCSGKSTLIDRLKNTLRWDSKSLHHKEGNQYERYLKEYANNYEIVFDRSHISEAVYSELWRGGTPFTKEESSILYEVALHDSLLIFACPLLETLQERYEARSYEQQIKLTELKTSRKLFCDEVNDSYDYLYESKTYTELDSLVEKIKRRIK